MSLKRAIGGTSKRSLCITHSKHSKSHSRIYPTRPTSGPTPAGSLRATMCTNTKQSSTGSCKQGSRVCIFAAFPKYPGETERTGVRITDLFTQGMFVRGARDWNPDIVSRPTGQVRLTLGEVDLDVFHSNDLLLPIG